jgi:hypothetical protein
MPTRLFALALLLVALPVAAERPKEVELKLDSKILHEERRVLVSLPASYKNEDQRYPVLYLLDAEMHLEHTIASADALAAVSRMPELIIVGISHTDRRKDLTPTVTRDAPAAAGGADRFGEFIATDARRRRSCGFWQLLGRTVANELRERLWCNAMTLENCTERRIACNQGWKYLSRGDALLGSIREDRLQLFVCADHFGRKFKHDHLAARH